MTTLVFNKKDREEFLTGFHKRKEDRKKKAKEQIAQKLKEERLIIRKKKQEIAKKLQNDSPWVRPIFLIVYIEPYNSFRKTYVCITSF